MRRAFENRRSDSGGALDGVLGYHLNPLTCGVAKFNRVLARRIGCPVLRVFDPAAAVLRTPLLSLKMSEFTAEDEAALESLLDRAPWRNNFALFLHAWADSPMERRLIRQAAVVYCGNAELVAELTPLRRDLVETWCPSTLLEPQRFERTELSVFCFGMAHKIRADLHDRLHALLEATGQRYAVYLSTALHEGTAFDESFTIAFEELRGIYGERIYFLGYLSDAAVYNYLYDTTFFAAFFDKGVRANNTTVNAALACGSVVVTNLDRYSPPAFRHMENVIDIYRARRLPTEAGALAALSASARATASGDLGWDRLIARLAEHASLLSGARRERR